MPPAANAARCWPPASAGGSSAFDFYLYVYGLPAILATFSLTKAAGGLLATYTLVASAIGGIVMGTLADRIGRKTALMISIAWYALFTFLSGVAQDYNQLAAFRALEGLGFGGEWAVGSVLISEWSQAARRGRNLGFVQGSWAIGWLAANVAFQVVVATVGPTPAGVTCSSWGSCRRSSCSTSAATWPTRRCTKRPARAAVPAFSLAASSRPEIVRTTVFASLLAIGVQTGYYALFTWMPTYLTTPRPHPAGHLRHVPVLPDRRLVRRLRRGGVHQRRDRAQANLRRVLALLGGHGAALPLHGGGGTGSC